MDIEKRKLEYEQWWEDHVDEQMYYIAHLLEKREEKELIEIERKAEAGELPKPSPEFHDSIMKIAQDADKKICRKRLQKLGRRCAIFFICFVIVGSVATASGDAWKNAFTNLFPKDKDDYITLYPFNVDELDDWSNYYIFSDIPENFSLVYAEDFETDKSIVFSDGKNQLAILQTTSNTVINFDNEVTTYEEIKIKGKPGYYFYSEEDKESGVLWMQGDYLLKVLAIGEKYISKENLLNLAENIIFIK